MQGIYTYIPEKNYVPAEYSVAAILLFLFMVHTSLAPVLNLLHFYISTFHSMCAVPSMAVFCSSLTSCLLLLLLSSLLLLLLLLLICTLQDAMSTVMTYY
jgi:ABC-type transport system involved in multi-copper enzyme maturation permease subunit